MPWLRDKGVDSRLDVVPGADHSQPAFWTEDRHLGRVASWFADQVRPDTGCDVTRWWQAHDRTTGEELPVSAWSIEADGRTVTVHEALAGHVRALSGKAYWRAIEPAPEFVIAFVPSEPVLAAALDHRPGLVEEALDARVVLASPATLHAVLRALAFAWQQDALADNARELLAVGAELHSRIGTLAEHTGRLGRSLRSSVEAYNKFVGTLESRVLITARSMRDLGTGGDEIGSPPAVEATPRVLTAPELIAPEMSDPRGVAAEPSAQEQDALRPRLEVSGAGR